MRKYDVVVYGATGFVGRLVTRYLAEHYPTASTGLRWGIAGRRRDALEEVRSACGLDEKIDILIFDLASPETIDEITKNTKCVISVAGPFFKVGMPLIESCVKNAANYVDITGEPLFIKKAGEQFHEEAARKKLKIVNCCGHDCIPADMGCEMMIAEAEKRKLTPVECRYNVVGAKGGISGGTIHSALGHLLSDSAVIEAAKNPYFLCRTAPDDASLLKKNADFSWFDFDVKEKFWCVANPMQVVVPLSFKFASCLTIPCS